jgi:hypothetical protein
MRINSVRERIPLMDGDGMIDTVTRIDDDPGREARTVQRQHYFNGDI